VFRSGWGVAESKEEAMHWASQGDGTVEGTDGVKKSWRHSTVPALTLLISWKSPRLVCDLLPIGKNGAGNRVSQRTGRWILQLGMSRLACCK